MLKVEIIVSAFSVAAFMATIRAICSLTAASAAKSFILKLVGTTSSSLRARETRSAFHPLLGRLFLAAGLLSGNRVSTTGLPAQALKLRVDHVEPVELRSGILPDTDWQSVQLLRTSAGRRSA